MTKILLPRGLQGSGKSTWAKQYVIDHPDTVRVCRDDLRFMLGFGWKFNRDNEKLVKEFRNHIIIELFNAGKNIIVDELNLSGNTERYLRQCYSGYSDVEFEIVDFTHVHPNVCIHRDGMRPVAVGSKTILQLWRKYIEPEYQSLDYSDLPTAIICDLDGTLSLFHDKNPYKRDFENDILNDRLNYILNVLSTDNKWHTGGHEIIIVSGRSVEFLEQTAVFLERHRVPFEHLYMRSEGDSRSDVFVKQEIYEKNIKGKYNILCVFDDRKQIKQFWVSQGLFVFDCNQHDVEF